MDRAGAPHGPSPRSCGEQGFTVIEVLVSLALFAVVASAVLATVTDSVGLARANESRVSASALAHRVLETARAADPAVAPVASQTVTVGGVGYTVTRSVESVQQAGGPGRCGVTPDRVVAQRLHVGVDWPDRRGQAPVKLSTLRTVDMNAVAPDAGTLYVVLEDADGASVGGVTVTLSPTGATATSDANGCAVFTAITPRADYVATISKAGYADPSGATQPSRGPLAVTRGGVLEELFVYSPFAPETPPSGFAVTPNCVPNPVPVPRSPFSTTSQSGTTIAGQQPAGLQSGDMLIAHLAVAGGPAAGTLSTPTGWTLLTTTVHTGNVTQALYTRVAGSTANPSYTWTYSSGGKAALGIGAWGGAHATAAVSTWNAASSPTASTGAVAPGVTVPWGNARLVNFWSGTGGVTFTPPTGTNWTERYDLGTGGGAGSTGHVSIGSSAEDVGAGATGTRTATMSGATPSVGAMIAVLPTRTPHAALSWSASSWPSAEGYYLRRNVGALLQRDWTVAGRTSTSSTDGALNNGTAYLYELSAYAGSNQTEPLSVTWTPNC